MNEFCAVMGLCNLKHIDEAIQARKERYAHYIELLQDTVGIKWFEKIKIPPIIMRIFQYLSCRSMGETEMSCMII